MTNLDLSPETAVILIVLGAVFLLLLLCGLSVFFLGERQSRRNQEVIRALQLRANKLVQALEDYRR
jgi:hypothetical protein